MRVTEATAPSRICTALALAPPFFMGIINLTMLLGTRSEITWTVGNERSRHGQYHCPPPPLMSHMLTPSSPARTLQKTPRQLPGSRSASSVSASEPANRGAGPSVLCTATEPVALGSLPREQPRLATPSPAGTSFPATGLRVVVDLHLRPPRPCFLLQTLSSSSAEPRLLYRLQNVLGPAGTDTGPSVRMPRLSSSHVYLTVEEA